MLRLSFNTEKPVTWNTYVNPSVKFWTFMHCTTLCYTVLSLRSIYFSELYHLTLELSEHLHRQGCNDWLGEGPILSPILPSGHYWGTALKGTKLYWTELHYTALHCISLHYTALHCISLHCTALHYSTALHCTVLYCTALW